MNCIRLRMKLHIHVPKYISSEVMFFISDEMYFGLEGSYSYQNTIR